jgi:HD superfamily phosphodiesterase
MTISEQVPCAAAQYVRCLFALQNDPRRLYHNLVHTTRVVAYAEIITAFNKLDAESHAALLVACWIHDIDT